ncbi:MAG TPA: STAS/SEC14 domain-containing protein [Solirubrobacterales bacterium]
MIERIDGMPTGTVGLRASGKLSRDDYREVLEPVLREAVDSGELRLVFVLTDFEGLEPGAWIEDVKTGLRVWVRDHSAWKRFALVTDVEWVAKAMRAFAWMAPGEVSVYRLDQLEEAKRWVGG